MQGDGPDPLGFRVPTPPSEPMRRPTIVTGAAAALAIAGTFSLAGILLLAGSGASTAAVAFTAGFGVVLLVAAVTVFLMLPWARMLGIAVGVVGMLFAVARIVGGTEQALLDLAAYGYVLFALGTSGPAFRRG